MKALLTILLFLLAFLNYAQEYLSPLRYNTTIKREQQKTGAIHNTFIYAIDTLNLPITDDFSTDKFKKYDADTTDANVSDTTWYRLSIGGVPEPMGTTYMIDTTFTFVYDTVPGKGFDSIILVNKIPFASTIVEVSDIDHYSVVTQNVEVWPAHNYYDSLWTGINPDLILVEQNPDLVQDSSTVYFVATVPEDSAYIWVDTNVYRNNTFAINPVTIGVATFDGINSNGYPYDWSSPSAYGVADVLTSKPINLGTKNGGGTYSAADSIYFSFLYQTKGLGDTPEYQDSLVLEFWSPVFAQWESVWRKGGFPQEDFKIAMIPITDSRYLADGFKFRFKNYGTLTGSLDHWHIDYVILDDFRTHDDTLMNDWAFQYPAPTLIKNYTAMPWPHYETAPYNLMKTTTSVTTYNSLNQPKIILPSGIDLLYKGTLVDNIPYVNTAGNVSGLSSFDMDYTIPSTFFFDTILADTCAVFDLEYTLNTNTTPERLKVNDTLRAQQVFESYYAYDDGTAEAAYGLVSNGAELAYKFTLPNGIQDTLRAVKMYFVSSVNDVSSDLFFLQVWDDNGGQPGNLIYTTDDAYTPVTYTPHYDIGNNVFYEYVLPQKLVVSGTYYVGWKQSSANRLNIGFDKNILNQSKIFYNVGSGWSNTSYQGSLMIRPVFTSKKDYLVHVIENERINTVKVYPNPSNGILNIETEFNIDNGSFSLFDITGREIINQKLNHNLTVVNTEFLEKGNYILVIKDDEGSIVAKSKVIIW